MATKLTKVEDTVTAKLKMMIQQTTFFEQYVLTRFQPLFQRVQQKRWQTENSSEGPRWAPIDKFYATYKKTKYSANFGHGDNLMIASGRLYKSLTLDNDGDWNRILSGTTVVFNFDVEYAAFADAVRPILEFSNQTLRRFRDDYKAWIAKQWQLKT